MFVLVEGIDGSGKTTLVNELNKKYSIIRPVRPDCYIFFNEQALTCTDEVYVFDRSVISEMVYRIYDGDLPKCNLRQTLHIINNSLIIYCKNLHSFKKSMERGEDNITSRAVSNKISQIYDTIIRMIEIYGLATVYEYDYQKQDVNNVINFIEDYRKVEE